MRHCPLLCTQKSQDSALRRCALGLVRQQTLARARFRRCCPCFRGLPWAEAAMARGDSLRGGARHSPKENKHRVRRESRAHGGVAEASRLRVGRRRVAACRVTRFQLAGRFAQLCGDFAQKFRAAPFRFRRDFLLDVAAQTRQFFLDALAKFFKFVHKRVRRTGRGDFGIIGTLRECRKEESWRFPINGNTGWTAGKRRCKVFSAAATNNPAPKFVPPVARWWELAPRAATSAARI